MIVIKYGGNAMTNLATRRKVARTLHELALAGEKPVVIHGGGPTIREALARLGIESRFVRGQRVTTSESLPVIEGALTTLGKILAQEVGRAVGLTGRDAHLLVAEPLDEALGLVGKVVRVNTNLITALLDAQLTPVIACLAENERSDGILNVNADGVAGTVAGALSAGVVFLTDVRGVLDDARNPDSLLTNLSAAEVAARIHDGRILGGMIPKVEAALEALQLGAPFAVIADGRNAETLPQTLRGTGGTRIHP